MTLPKGWHAEDIKAAVRKSGTTLGAIAIEAGYDRSYASHCLRQPYPAVNKAIADHLGKSLHALWPDWFDEDGNLKPRDRKGSTRAETGQRQKRAAA